MLLIPAAKTTIGVTIYINKLFLRSFFFYTESGSRENFNVTKMDIKCYTVIGHILSICMFYKQFSFMKVCLKCSPSQLSFKIFVF